MAAKKTAKKKAAKKPDPIPVPELDQVVEMDPSLTALPDLFDPCRLLAVFHHAPPAGECQHIDYTSAGARPSRVRCLDCGKTPLIEEALDAAQLRAWGVRP